MRWRDGKPTGAGLTPPDVFNPVRRAQAACTARDTHSAIAACALKKIYKKKTPRVVLVASSMRTRALQRPSRRTRCLLVHFSQPLSSSSILHHTRKYIHTSASVHSFTPRYQYYDNKPNDDDRTSSASGASEWWGRGGSVTWPQAAAGDSSRHGNSSIRNKCQRR